MKLSAIQTAGLRATDYLERYVNDGSPSGFTLHDQMSAKTNPLSLEPYFYPLRVTPSAKARSERFLSALFESEETLLAPLVHPDASEQIRAHGIPMSRETDMRLVPTSSGRTCRLLDDASGAFVKLHYPARLGRIDRSLPYYKAVAGIEVSDEICTTLADGGLPAKIAILPETAAVITHAQADDFSFGHVVRRGTPYPTVPLRPRIPLFSLWSFDRLSPLDACILAQIFETDPKTAHELAADICSTLVDFVFDLWLSTGLLYEVNAQNVLVELDSTNAVQRLVLRDFNSTEKDVHQRRELGRPSNFASGEYKLLPENDAANAARRRSFAFDFKLCHYAVRPLASALERLDRQAGEELIEKLRAHVGRRARDLPPDFFPRDGTWWSHPEVDLSIDRPYIQSHNPMLR